MARISKNRKAVMAKYNAEKGYSLDDAAKVLKDITFTKFDASVDLDIRLGVDPKKSDQMVRGVVSLPHGLGKVASGARVVHARQSAGSQRRRRRARRSR